MKEIMERRFGKKKMGDDVESSSEDEEETPKKQKRTSCNLIAKKRVGGGAKMKSRKGATAASKSKGKKVQMKRDPSKSDLGHKHGGMLPGISTGQTPTGFCHRPGYYTMDAQGRTFDQYGKEFTRKERSRQLKRPAMRSDKWNQKKKI